MEEKNNLEAQATAIVDLIDLKKWQKIQDVFASVANISVRTIDSKGNAITAPSSEPRLCREILKPHPNKYTPCDKCLPTFLGGTAVVDRNMTFSCLAGLSHFIAKLKLDNEVLGYIVLGPVMAVSRQAPEYYRKVADDLGVDFDAYWYALLEIKILSFYRLQKIVEIIEEISGYILNQAFQNLKMKASIGEFSYKWSQKLAVFLDKVLSAALQISGADIGSIMLLDAKNKELTIRASHGLPDEVVENTRVRIGEGISGRAVEENTSFLIDDYNPDNRIKQYLNRPQIKSSMVLPIKIDDSVLGVLNLGALETSAVRFNMDNVKSMNSLADLATLAIKALI